MTAHGRDIQIGGSPNRWLWPYISKLICSDLFVRKIIWDSFVTSKVVVELDYFIIFVFIPNISQVRIPHTNGYK